MRISLTFWALLCALFWATEVNGAKKRKKDNIRASRIDKVGGLEILQEKCLFIPSYGTCKKFIKVFGYDYMSNRCTEFMYSGCGGNPNRFPSEITCRNVCFVNTKSEFEEAPDYYSEYDDK
ncbi:early lactation protein [Drosophila ficusphila]|uniref:early lactation protein n=1 Tax=Drosophila ficusphila TaxID=30025 RepID=UPI0007E8A240|nr:early lactation protein [Drosophila ficusphila]